MDLWRNPKDWRLPSTAVCNRTEITPVAAPLEPRVYLWLSLWAHPRLGAQGSDALRPAALGPGAQRLCALRLRAVRLKYIPRSNIPKVSTVLGWSTVQLHQPPPPTAPNLHALEPGTLQPSGSEC